MVILQVLHFQVQMSNWTSCHRPNTWILFSLWFKSNLQYDFVMIIHFLHFQVQISNWTSCHNPNTWILLALWFKTTLQYEFVMIIESALSSPDVKLNLLLQSQHTKPVCSLILNCFSVWHCGDTSCPAIKSPYIKWISCYDPNTWILFALWFKVTLQYDFVVTLQVLQLSRCEIEPLVTIQTDESCSLFDSKLLCSITLWWYYRSFTFKSRCEIESHVTIPTHESFSLFDSKLLFSMTLW